MLWLSDRTGRCIPATKFFPPDHPIERVISNHKLKQRQKTGLIVDKNHTRVVFVHLHPTITPGTFNKIAYHHMQVCSKYSLELLEDPLNGVVEELSRHLGLRKVGIGLVAVM